ncbi:hypothetical protein HCN44_003930 [Aphidius gifuensis]|uniref:Uncharacterized protein n=1 Tax=Aphidius gifuensis TaxID=684658 RepID=A0A835CUL7_APHGI|nr:uncharacterized protein LOC122848178 isoform X1 [Aphidius gifuensis]XP_044002000.1 uncharacterized protein LOC122848178 isoform X1 [Aphidius gifuensis]XP_044002001.1 uncharacterized protein LOC122848178 isoform X1 [Aphidius gifuensis]KAF7994458.1 hypothetical protein HCN44_003930 [Aphidius gifuensis]
MFLRWSKLIEQFGKGPCVVVIFLPCLLICTLYLISEKYQDDYEIFENNIKDEVVDGYLVWNQKCHMLSKDPLDPTIKKFVSKLKFESCSNKPLLSSIKKQSNGKFSLVVDKNVAKSYKQFTCCWTPISRTIPKLPPTGEWDTQIDIGECEDFDGAIELAPELEIVMISCRQKHTSKLSKSSVVYENIHAIINPLKVKDKLTKSSVKNSTLPTKNQQKMSVLMLGVDSVSRLNFHRTLPKTLSYLNDNEWYNLKGYNKMGENTFPNLMAILTGQESDTAYERCKPHEAFGLNNCPFLWNNFRNIGYVTAYGEDTVPISTFNYLKTGFWSPPTDYYMRPYMYASEKLLKIKKRFRENYCTGPELATDRIFNYAIDFAKTFMNKPYFGFFWTNTISHEDMNGPSSMDEHFLQMFRDINDSGIINDTIIIFLSDHGTRWGGMRDTLVGWQEERLPFIYLHLPKWIDDNANIFQALRLNEHRLTSPFDIYETLREVLINSGGYADKSSGCLNCQSVFKPVPITRGCDDAGISPHWCACNAYEETSKNNKIAYYGANMFIEHVENIIKHYKNNKGQRLCAKLKIKKIIRVDKIIGLNNNDTINGDNIEGYFYLVEVTPGGGKFELSMRRDENGKYTIKNEEIGRINFYQDASKCLDHGSKRFCYCLKQ